MKSLDDFTPGMRVRFKDEAMGPSFPRGGGYRREPPKQSWTGEVSHTSPPGGAGVVWVQWDSLPKGTHRPVMPSMLMRENARPLVL